MVFVRLLVCVFVVLWARRPIDMLEAVNISPAVALNSIGLFSAYFFKIVLPSSPHVFSTVSNLSYLLAAFCVQHRATSGYDGVAPSNLRNSYMVSNLSTCASIFLTLLGSSSFAFHSESVLFQPSHSFDILFGWLLVLNIAFTALTVSFYAWAGRRLTRQLHTSIFVGFLIAISALLIGYDTVYKYQLEFMTAMATTGIVCAVVSRMLLIGERPTATTIGYAIGEMIILICIVISAMFCQGELIGRRISRDTAPEAYDVAHGQWHFLLSTSASIVYIRSLSVARMVEAGNPVCVCRPSRLDMLGELALFAFAVTASVLKEVDMYVSDGVVLVVTGIVSCGLYVHACATAVDAVF